MWKKFFFLLLLFAFPPLLPVPPHHHPPTVPTLQFTSSQFLFRKVQESHGYQQAHGISICHVLTLARQPRMRGRIPNLNFYITSEPKYITLGFQFKVLCVISTLVKVLMSSILPRRIKVYDLPQNRLDAIDCLNN